jgi:hypothetical protein
MSACISGHGEYSDQEYEGADILCGRCGAMDEDAVIAKLAQHQLDLDHAVASERAKAEEAMKSRDDMMRALWIVASRYPDGLAITEAELVDAPQDVTLRSSENPITHGILIEAIESGAHNGQAATGGE